MADWYCGSVQHAAVAQWAALTAYVVGDIRRQLAAPAVGSERCFRVSAITTGISGAGEPAWNLAKGAATTDSGVTWTEITGNSAYAWAAPWARIWPITSSWMAAGDTLYVAHDHAATQATSITAGLSFGSPNSPCRIICVDAGGSVPPVSADLRYTATESTTGNSSLALAMSSGYVWVSGITWSAGTGASGSAALTVHSNSSGVAYGHFYKCGFTIGSTHSTPNLNINSGISGTIVFEQCVAAFGSVSQSIFVSHGYFTWINSPAALGGATFPTILFGSSSGAEGRVLLDGVDLSALGAGKTIMSTTGGGNRLQAVNCKLGASVTLADAPANTISRADFVISDSTNVGHRQARYSLGAVLSENVTYTRVGGASDGVQEISWEVVTTASNNALAPFECFTLAAWNAATGSPITATVEIESDATLTNREIWLEVEYLGTAGFPVASFVSSLPADMLAAASNLPASSATWNGGLGSAVKQYLQVTFTPQMTGLVRATVYVAKASETIYIDPKLTLA